MVGSGKKKGTVRFSLNRRGTVTRVAVAGDFSEWRPRQLRKGADGFSLSLVLPPGTYQYKFIVDGEWIIDPDNNQWALSPIGTMNSVVEVD